MAQTCPLADPSIGIVSENDHRVGLCLCRYCTCQQHTCSKAARPNLTSAFSTRYRSEFSRKAPGRPPRRTGVAYRPNTAAMDFTTTNKADFTPKKTEKPHRAGASQRAKTPGSVPSGTSYSSTYLNWGPVAVQHEKQWHPPVRSTELSFQANSAYRDSFRILKNSTPAASLVKQASLNIGKGERLDSGSTYRSTMQNFADSQLNQRIVVKPPAHRAMSASPNHFGTTTASFFKGTTPDTVRDPRQVKRQLQRVN